MDSAELQAWWESMKRSGRLHAEGISDAVGDATEDYEPINLSDDLDAPYEFDTYAELRDEARREGCDCEECEAGHA